MISLIDASMLFHTALTGLFVGNLFSLFEGPNEQFGTNVRCARYVKKDPRVVGLRPKSVYL